MQAALEWFDSSLWAFFACALIGVSFLYGSHVLGKQIVKLTSNEDREVALAKYNAGIPRTVFGVGASVMMLISGIALLIGLYI